MFIFGHIGLSFAALYVLGRKIKNIDYRFLILGSLLPDIIDKPLGLVVFADTLYNGRIIAHTAVFALAVSVLSLRARKLRMLSAGIWLHLLMDFMFLYPETLLWPAFGGFRPLDYRPDFVVQLISNPYTYAGEIAGFSFLMYIFVKYRLYRRENFMRFVRTGKLE
ncbi:MAG: metal-dependent hydrolase [Candidatus Aenigmarchaeota archaeon]|nr:metal-dependent hydrolase [Candidatus Aenigmarchaeota archaeon]